MNRIFIFLFLTVTAGVFAQTGPCFSSPVLSLPTLSADAFEVVASGDLNNDGNRDIVAASYGGDKLAFYITNGAGGISYASTFTLGTGGPRSIALADFNNDAFLDIAVTSPNTVYFLISDGTGNFLGYTMTVINPYGIAAGDFNGDGNQDLVMTNFGGNTVMVCLGNGDGTFGGTTNYMVGSGPLFVAVGYMNADTIPDIVTANVNSDNVSVLTGIGNGTFNASITTFLGTGNYPNALSIGDFNNDGINDVVTANSQSNDLTVLIGTGGGSLFVGATYPVIDPYGITSGQYDSDANPDFAVTSFSGKQVIIFKGDGLGSFTQDSSYPLDDSPGHVITDDFNNDGFSDIAVADDGLFGAGSGNAYILLNHRAKITATTPASFCNGGNVLLVANHGTGFVYNWSPSGTTNDSLLVSASGNISLTITNGDGTCSTSVSQAVVEYPQPVVSGVASPAAVCNGQQTVLTGAGALSYTWSNGVVNGVPFVPSSSGTYTVTGTDANGCSGTATVAVNFSSVPVQEVCTVTTDSATGNHNVIIWEKPGDTGNIDSFFVYREITLNNYLKIGAVHVDSLSEFHDFGANPNATGYRYKIATLDTCGNTGALGLWHNSIHLQYFGGGNFTWNKYEIETGNFPALSYDFYRDDNATGNWTLLQTVSGSQTSFTDVNYASFPIARYRVEVGWNISCTPTRGAINTSRSNIKSPSSVGIRELVNDLKVNVYPNPAVNLVVFETDLSVKNATVKLYNHLGEMVLVGRLTENKATLDISGLAVGVYTYKLEAEKVGTKTGKISKQY